MRTLIAILTVLIGWAGVLQAQNEDEDGSRMTYTNRLALYDGNDLSCYYSTARLRLEDGFVRHWLKLEPSLNIPYYVDVGKMTCNGKPVPGEYRLGANKPVVYIYSDDEEPTAKWHIETEIKK